jgi:hypothetical protein
MNHALYYLKVAYDICKAMDDYPIQDLAKPVIPATEGKAISLAAEFAKLGLERLEAMALRKSE